MNKEKQIQILKCDGCTKYEAVKAIEAGVIIYDGEDFEENLERYFKEWELEESSMAEFREMLKTGSPIEGWGVVEDGKKKYYIEYVL